MDKFAIDLDKVLDDFEFNEDCAEQVASGATSTIDASVADERAAESVPPKTYRCIALRSEKSREIDVTPSFDEFRDARPMDIDPRYLLIRENAASASENKDSSSNCYSRDCIGDDETGPKACVPPGARGADRLSLTSYDDVSRGLLSERRDGSGDSKDDDRYDEKLNRPNVKPSISNVFNSLNEYINAPTGSLDCIEPVSDQTDRLSDASMRNEAERDRGMSVDTTIGERSTSRKRGIMDIVVDTNALDYADRILPMESNAFVRVRDIDQRERAMDEVALRYPPLSMRSEKKYNAVISASNTAAGPNYERDRVAVRTELYCDEVCIDDRITTDESTRERNSRDIADERLDSGDRVDERLGSGDRVGERASSENKESIAECIEKLDVGLTSDTENGDTTTAEDASSEMRPTRANDIDDDFSEEELNRYLIELEEEERSKKRDTFAAYDGSSDSTAGNFHRYRGDDEDVDEAPVFERITIGRLPKISETFKEKAIEFPVIDYGTDIRCEDTTDVLATKGDAREFNDAMRIALPEINGRLKDTELDKSMRDDRVVGETIALDVAVRENIFRVVSDGIAAEEKTTLMSDDIGERCDNDVDVSRRNIDTDVESRDSSDIAVRDLSEDTAEGDREDEAYRDVSRITDVIENSESDVLPLNDDRKTDVVPRIVDVCTVSRKSESNQEALDKPTRPRTLDIVTMRDKDDSRVLESSNATPGEPEHSETRGTVDDDRGASSDVSDNSLVECNTVLGKQPPFWIPDSDAPCCMLCDVRFTVLKRRHHCRACGKVLCNKCCNMKYRLEYQGNIDSRVCVLCHRALTKAENEQEIGDWSTNYNSYSGCSDINSPQGRQPNPNNPMEYCSTVPPLQQLAGGLPPPPTVMVPVGVLKREGSKHRTEGQKSVMFSDGIRPGCDLTELDTCWDLKPPYRRQGNKRILASGSTSTDATSRRQSHPPLDSTTDSYVPHEPSLLPPTVTIHKGRKEVTIHPPMDENVLYKTLKNECEPPVMFAINRNLYAYVKITNLNCCVNKICWNVTSRGLACVGQDEIILLVETLPDETRIPKDLLIYINQLYLEAIKGNTMMELGFSVFQGGNLLGSREHAGFLFIRQTLQCLQKIVLPPAPFLVGLLVHRWETPWAKVFPLRLLLRLGAEYRYYPCPLVSVRFRDALYFEIGHTVMKVLADFRNFGYTLPGVRGLTIHLKNRTTDVMFPRNRYDQVIKGLHNSNDHVLAYASNFSISADSHLVCIQTNTGDESNYQTQAINIHNKPRTVTGASFIVINGALKSSMGLSAKSSIVEDGLMVEIMPEKMEALKAALRNMQDFSIGCGRQGAPEPDETVNIKWIDNDVLFNLGVKSPIDGQLMDGIPSIRVHNGTDYKGTTRFIRWTEVFIVKSDDHSNGVNDPVDINKLSGNIAKATCAALVKLLDLLATAGLTKLGVRATIHPDNVGYEAGSEGTKLPPIYMNSLDNELIQVLHKAAQSSQDTHTVLELIFYVLDD